MDFVFLSKLIPLFFYPLGLVSLLLILIIFLSWKQRSWIQLPAVLALIIILVGGNVWVSKALMRSLEWQNLPPTEMPQAEAIVILGGGIYPNTYPRSMPEVAEAGDRVLYGAKLYQAGKAPLIIASGGRIEWLGGGTPEAQDMATLLEMMGVPKSAIIEEPDSLNTYENAVNVQKILQQQKINQVLLVTSAFHMPRSRRIFEKLGIQVIPAPTDFSVIDEKNADFNLKTILIGLFPDTNFLNQTVIALKEYLGLFIYSLKGWA
ncbi:MAG: YdcF family protein [Snowella sp.]|nr:YdcF family protein [Snowella sp.]